MLILISVHKYILQGVDTLNALGHVHIIQGNRENRIDRPRQTHPWRCELAIFLNTYNIEICYPLL